MSSFTIFFLFILGILVGFRAKNLGRSFFVWTICSFFFTPLITWLILEISGNKNEITESNKTVTKKVRMPFQFQSIETQEEDKLKNSASNNFQTKKEDVFDHNFAEQNSTINNDLVVENESLGESKQHISIEKLQSNSNNSISKDLSNHSFKAFSSKVVSFSLTKSQKTIYGISSFLIVFIIAFVFAEDIDSNIELRNTWGIWIVFIILQAWVQNKIWNSDNQSMVTIYYPNIPIFSKLMGPNVVSQKKDFNTENDFKVSQLIKRINPNNIRDGSTLLILGLFITMIILLLIAVISK